MNRWVKTIGIALGMSVLVAAKAGPFSGGGVGETFYLCLHNGEWFANTPASSSEQAYNRCAAKHDLLSPDPEDHPPMMVDASPRLDRIGVSASSRKSTQNATDITRDRESQNQIVHTNPHCVVDESPINN